MTSPDGARIGPLPVRQQLVMMRDHWPHEGVELTVEARGGGMDGMTVPNAQHAVRQAKLLAKNIVLTMRGGTAKTYVHRSLGAVATLGLGTGVFQSGPLVVKGFPAWLMHRGYHVHAIPSWERKWRVAAGWANNLLLGRDTVGLHDVQTPRATFTNAVALLGEPLASPSADRRYTGGHARHAPFPVGMGRAHAAAVQRRGNAALRDRLREPSDLRLLDEK